MWHEWHITACESDGPLGEPVVCEYGIIAETKTAVIEMSGAASITLVPDAKKNPLYTTTYGVGEVIRDAIEKGCRRFIVVSAAVPQMTAVIGMLQALGYGFLNKDRASRCLWCHRSQRIRDYYRYVLFCLNWRM